MFNLCHWFVPEIISLMSKLSYSFWLGGDKCLIGVRTKEYPWTWEHCGCVKTSKSAISLHASYHFVGVFTLIPMSLIRATKNQFGLPAEKGFREDCTHTIHIGLIDWLEFNVPWEHFIATMRHPIWLYRLRRDICGKPPLIRNHSRAHTRPLMDAAGDVRRPNACDVLSLPLSSGIAS